MQLPLTDPETLFEDLLQALPPETVPMARACKAFVRAKKPRRSRPLGNSCGSSSSIVAWTNLCARWPAPLQPCSIQPMLCSASWTRMIPWPNRFVPCSRSTDVSHAADLGTTLCDPGRAAARTDRMSGAPSGHTAAALGRPGPRGRRRQHAPARQRRRLAQAISPGQGSPT
jgi:hypothetical protein